MRALTLVILCTLVFGAQTTVGQNKTDIIIGNQFTIKSKILNEENHRSVPLIAIYEGLLFVNQEN